MTASDGTLSGAQTITVNLTDNNDNAPTITSSAAFTVAENRPRLAPSTPPTPMQPRSAAR